MLRQKFTRWQFGLLFITLMSCGLITAPADGATGAALTNVFTLDTRLTPTIQTITPGSGSISGGTAVTIRGTNFVIGKTTVKFGDKSATNVDVQSATQLTGTTPPGSAGRVTVQVINPGGTVATLTNGFTYEAPVAAKVTVTASPASIVANGQMTAQISVTVEASDGTRITNETVNLTADRGQIDATAKHQGNGVYTATYTAATIAGEVKITAVTGNGKLGTTTIRLTEREIDPAKSTVGVDSNVVAADGKTQATVTITVVDKQGLRLSGKKVELSTNVILSEAKELNLLQPSPTNADGLATAKISSTKAGVVTITATVDGVALSQKPTIEFISGDVAHGKIEAGGLHTVGESVQVTVTVKNAQERPVAGKTVALGVTPADGVKITQPTAKTDASGITTATFTSTKAELKTISAKVVEDNLTLTETAAVLFDAAAPEQVSVSAVDSLVVSGSTAVKASVTDGYGNPVKNTDVKFTATLGGLTASTNNGDGTYTATYTAPARIAGVQPPQTTINATTPNGKTGSAKITIKEEGEVLFVETFDTPELPSTLNYTVDSNFFRWLIDEDNRLLGKKLLAGGERPVSDRAVALSTIGFSPGGGSLSYLVDIGRPVGTVPGGSDVGLVFGDYVAVFHPGHPNFAGGGDRGAFRLEKGIFDDKILVNDQDIGFIPALDSMHHVEAVVTMQADGLAINITITGRGTDSLLHTYRFSFVDRAPSLGRGNIGVILRGQNPPGTNDGFFDNLQVEGKNGAQSIALDSIPGPIAKVSITAQPTTLYKSKLPMVNRHRRLLSQFPMRKIIPFRRSNFR